MRRENNSTSADGHDRLNGAGADSVESDAVGVDVGGDRRVVAAGAVAAGLEGALFGPLAWSCPQSGAGVAEAQR